MQPQCRQRRTLMEMDAQTIVQEEGSRQRHLLRPAANRPTQGGSGVASRVTTAVGPLMSEGDGVMSSTKEPARLY